MKKTYPRGKAPEISPGIFTADYFWKNVVQAVRDAIATISNPAIILWKEAATMALLLNSSIGECNQLLTNAWCITGRSPDGVVRMAVLGYNIKEIREAIATNTITEHVVAGEIVRAWEAAFPGFFAGTEEEDQKKDQESETPWNNRRLRKRQQIESRMQCRPCETRPKRICIHRKRCDTMRHLNVLLW